MPTPELLTQKELSEQLGVSRPLISQLSKTKFKDAVIGKMFDPTHPVILEYIETRKTQKLAVSMSVTGLTAKAKKKPAKKTKPRKTNKATAIPPISAINPPTFEEIEALTVREVVERYGSMLGFKVYLDSLRNIADWKNKELKYLESRGKLVSKAVLGDVLFALVNSAFKRIVGEFPGAVSPQLKAKVLANEDTCILEMKALMEKELSKILKDVKTRVSKDLKKGYDRGKQP